MELKKALIGFCAILSACGPAAGGKASQASQPAPVTSPTPAPNQLVPSVFMRDANGDVIGHFLGFPGILGGANNFAFIMTPDGHVGIIDTMTGKFRVEEIYFESANCSDNVGYFKMADSTQPLMLKGRLIYTGASTVFSLIDTVKTDVTVHSLQRLQSAGGCVPANLTMPANLAYSFLKLTGVTDFQAVAPIGVSQ